MSQITIKCPEIRCNLQYKALFPPIVAYSAVWAIGLLHPDCICLAEA